MITDHFLSSSLFETYKVSKSANWRTFLLVLTLFFRRKVADLTSPYLPSCNSSTIPSVKIPLGLFLSISWQTFPTCRPDSLLSLHNFVKDKFSKYPFCFSVSEVTLILYLRKHLSSLIWRKKEKSKEGRRNMRIIITQGISLNFLEPPRTFSKSNCFEIDVYWLNAHLFVKKTFLQKILRSLVNETRLLGVKRG